jgi:AraC-like DNA-binding protein
MNSVAMIQPIVFSTDGEAFSSRLDAWNAAFGSLNEITAAFGEKVGNVRCEYWLLGGGMVLSHTSVVPARFVRDRARSRKNQIDHWVLRVLRRGRGQLRHSSFEATTLPGELVLFSMHETWTVEWGYAEWVSLCFPRDLDLRLSAGLAALGPGLLRGPGAGLLADLMLALPARLAATSAEQLPTLAGAVNGSVSACLFARGSSLGVLPARDAATESARERVRRVILHNIGSAQLKPRDVARAAGLSRSSLYRLFESDGGIARYIRQFRLALAHDALCDRAKGSRTISAIAEAHGFPEPSDFSRAFRAVYGMSPREARGTTGRPAGIPLLSAHQRRSATAQDLAARLYLPAVDAS